MNVARLHRILLFLIAAVWIVNGLFCKVLNGVPRHRQIVAAILGPDHADALTIAIGWAEVAMAIWILSQHKKNLNAFTQIAVIGIMNILETLLAPELLLWGKVNLIFALLFMFLIYFNQFVLAKQPVNQG
jgi:hypothetical protein